MSSVTRNDTGSIFYLRYVIEALTRKASANGFAPSEPMLLSRRSSCNNIVHSDGRQLISATHKKPKMNISSFSLFGKMSQYAYHSDVFNKISCKKKSSQQQNFFSLSSSEYEEIVDIQYCKRSIGYTVDWFIDGKCYEFVQVKHEKKN